MLARCLGQGGEGVGVVDGDVGATTTAASVATAGGSTSVAAARAAAGGGAVTTGRTAGATTATAGSGLSVKLEASLQGHNLWWEVWVGNVQSHGASHVGVVECTRCEVQIAQCVLRGRGNILRCCRVKERCDV